MEETEPEAGEGTGWDYRKAFVAWGNTDTTEGRGHRVPLVVCERETTATRLGKGKSVQGSDCPVEEVIVYRIGGHWYGPVRLVGPTVEDDRAQTFLNAKRAAMKKAKDAGLSDEEIELLTK